jgi:hypothetical protein
MADVLVAIYIRIDVMAISAGQAEDGSWAHVVNDARSRRSSRIAVLPAAWRHDPGVGGQSHAFLALATIPGDAASAHRRLRRGTTHFAACKIDSTDH